MSRIIVALGVAGVLIAGALLLGMGATYMFSGSTLYILQAWRAAVIEEA